MGDFLPWVPLGTVSGGKTKSPSKAAGRVLAGEQGTAEVSNAETERGQARRALLQEAREERRKLRAERQAAYLAERKADEEKAFRGDNEQ